jgi:TPR repeat protein
MSADAHLALALGEMPFELNGNAIPPKLFHGEYGNGRGMRFVQDITGSASSSSGSQGIGVGNTGSDVKGASSTGESHPREANSRKKRHKEEYNSLWSFLQSHIYSKNGKDTSPTHNRGQHDGEQTNANTNTNANANSTTLKQNEKAALHHLEMAAELGNADAQNILANILASGILPFDDHPELRESTRSDHQHDHGHGAALEVQADFAEGGQQLAKAILLWHMSAMDGNVEAAMTLGYRHVVSATSGSDTTKLITEEMLGQFHASGFPSDEQVNSIIASSNGKGNGNSNSNTHNNVRRKKNQDKSIMHSPLASAHYGVLGTCETSLAYFEAAANSIMDELEASPLRGKVSPARDHHKLAEIHHRGASSKLAHYNKPDELVEAIKYYKMLADHPQNPDINAAYKVANMYHYGLRGVKQDMAEALKYYEIAGKLNSWEAAGQAGKFHLWGMGVEGEERSLKKAYDYFRMGTPGGVHACKLRFQKKLTVKEQNVDADWPFGGENTFTCDHPAVNGMGLLHLYGVPMMVS